MSDTTDAFDKEMLAIMKSYCGSDPRERRTVTDDVLHEYGGETWTLADFLSLVNDAVNKIPLPARDDAWVSLEGGYDESTILRIAYDRPETDGEVAERVASAAAYARDKLASERASYERLKQKFG